MIDYLAIIEEEEHNTDKIYLYPMQSPRGWIAYNSSAEHLHALLPNIPYGVKAIIADDIEYQVKVFIIDRLSLNSLLKRVNYTHDKFRLIIIYNRENLFNSIFCARTEGDK